MTGGFDLAFDRAGMECAWQCEIDKQASEVLAHHWPNVKNIGDVRNVGRNTVEHVDLICGGFPCQDVSIAGRREGLAGKRSGLWFEFERIIDELEPGWVVIENVPGLLSSNGGRDFEVIIRWLAERGYGVCWRVFDAQYFGVAQRRRRVFIVASFGNGRAAEVLFEREGLRWDAAKGADTGTEISHALNAHHSASGRYDPSEETYINTSTGVRGLTPTECARLQGFPDDWNDWLKDAPRYRQFGNAVAVPVAEWIGKRIMEITNENNNL